MKNTDESDAARGTLKFRRYAESDSARESGTRNLTPARA